MNGMTNDPKVAVQLRGLAKAYPGRIKIKSGCCCCCKFEKTSPYHAVKVNKQILPFILLVYLFFLLNHQLVKIRHEIERMELSHTRVEYFDRIVTLILLHNL